MLATSQERSLRMATQTHDFYEQERAKEVAKVQYKLNLCNQEM